MPACRHNEAAVPCMYDLLPLPRSRRFAHSTRWTSRGGHTQYGDNATTVLTFCGFGPRVLWGTLAGEGSAPQCTNTRSLLPLKNGNLLWGERPQGFLERRSALSRIVLASEGVVDDSERAIVRTLRVSAWRRASDTTTEFRPAPRVQTIRA